jgi:hypothetical protein
MLNVTSNSIGFDMEVVYAFCHRHYAGGEYTKVWNLKRAVRCMGSYQVHNHYSGYLKQFLRNHKAMGLNAPPFLSLNLLMDAHEASMASINLVDDDLSDLLIWLDVHGIFNTSAVLLLSDHGQYYGPYHNLFGAGTKEQRLPVFLLSLPNWYLHKHPEVHIHLQQNQQKLITAYDIYKTLIELPSFPSPVNYSRFGLANPPWAYNLFGSKIPSNRTCAEAHIPEYWCVCNRPFVGLKEDPFEW